VTAGLAASLGLLTIFWHDWIEAIFKLDPDNHSGAAEWITVTALVVVAVACATFARLDWVNLQHLSTIRPLDS
jgi:hypothetical protein